LRALPSPPLSDSESEIVADNFLFQASLPTAAPAVSQKNARKRRLTDPESSIQPKRQRRMSPTVPSQMVSDVRTLPTLASGADSGEMDLFNLGAMATPDLFQLPSAGLFGTTPLYEPVHIASLNGWSDVCNVNLGNTPEAFLDGMISYF
jgi:hypothetical protein